VPPHSFVAVAMMAPGRPIGYGPRRFEQVKKA
jgi:hypothetical protein